MKDFLGTELVVGDWVIFTEKSYRNLWIGRIKTITPKTILIEHTEAQYSKETRQVGAQVIKVDITKVPQRYLMP